MIYKFVGTMAGFFAAAMAFFPAVAPAATTVDLQSQIVDLRCQSIVMIQTQMNQSGSHISILGQTELKGVSDVTITETVPNQAASNSTPMQIASKRGARHSLYPGIGAPGSCPVYSNYLRTTGEYLSRSDGNLITIREPGKNAPSSLPVSDKVFGTLENIPPGTRLTFFSKYTGEGLPTRSSAQILTIYCVELAP